MPRADLAPVLRVEEGRCRSRHRLGALAVVHVVVPEEPASESVSLPLAAPADHAGRDDASVAIESIHHGVGARRGRRLRGEGPVATSQVGGLGDLVVLRDIDSKGLGVEAAGLPAAETYTDFGKLLEEMTQMSTRSSSTRPTTRTARRP